MADGDRPERIEIELAPHAPSGAQAADAHPVVASEQTVEIERTKLWVGAAVVGLIALLMGFVLGRTGSGGEPVAGGPGVVPSTFEPASTTMDESVSTIEPVREPFIGESTVAPSQRVQPSSPTTSNPPADAEISTIGIDPALAGRDVTLVAVTGRGDVIDVDLATGQTETRSTGRFLLDSTGLAFVGADWVMLPRFDGGRMSTVLFDDGTVAEIETGEGWSLIHQPGTDRFWRSEDDPFSLGSIVEFDLTGRLTGRAIDLVGRPIASDPLGGIVVHGSGGSYAVTPDDATRLTPGTLVGVGRTVMLVHECDVAFECEYAVVDRATDERRPFEPVGLSDSFHLEGWFGAPSEVDPGEEAMLLFASDPARRGPPSLGVLDLVTGEFAALDSMGQVSRATFTPDGESVVFVRRGELMVFDWRTGETIEVSPDLANIQAVGVRPSS